MPVSKIPTCGHMEAVMHPVKVSHGGGERDVLVAPTSPHLPYPHACMQPEGVAHH